MRQGEGWLGEVMDWDVTLSYRAALSAHERVQHTPAVTAFRDRHLPDGLLANSPRRIKAWLHARASDADSCNDDSDPADALGLGSLAKSIRDPLRREHPRRVPDPELPNFPIDLSVSARCPTGDGVFSSEYITLTAAPKMVVGELFWLGLHLQNEYGWDPAFARGWVVVEGAIPWVHSLGRSGDHSTDPRPPDMNRHRIFIDAAVELPIRRLASYASEVIERSVPERIYPPIARPIDLAILEATLFAVKLNDGRHAWEDVLEAWNGAAAGTGSEYPHGREGALSFAKDVRRTYKALLGETLKWKRGPGKPRGGHE